jgi:hypothetical protein
MKPHPMGGFSDNEDRDKPTCICLDSANNQINTKNNNLDWTPEEAEVACKSRCDNDCTFPLKGTYLKDSWYGNKIGNFFMCDYDDKAYYNHVSGIKTSAPTCPTCPACNPTRQPTRRR